jgi:hypothetical protein
MGTFMWKLFRNKKNPDNTLIVESLQSIERTLKNLARFIQTHTPGLETRVLQNHVHIKQENQQKNELQAL